MNTFFPFIKQCILHPKVTGAVAPASRFLARAMVEKADFSSMKSLVEFGPGTGAITKEIIKRLKSDTKYFSIEINMEMIHTLKKQFPNLNVHHDSVENLSKYLKKNYIKKVDAILSGLPFTNFDNEYQTTLMKITHDALKDGGIFITYAYIPGMVFPSALKFRKLLQNTFKSTDFSTVVWRNIPAAYVYYCQK